MSTVIFCTNNICTTNTTVGTPVTNVVTETIITCDTNGCNTNIVYIPYIIYATNTVYVTNVLSFYTNVFCFTTYLTNIVNSATADQDYVPVNGTLTFDDWQMSQDIFVPVIQSGNSGFPIVNHVLIFAITNVSLDPLESRTSRRLPPAPPPPMRCSIS